MFKQRKIRILIFCIVILTGVILALAFRASSNVIENLGLNLATAGFIALLLEAILRDELLDLVRRQLAATVKELGTGQTIGPLYLSAFRKADERVDIIALTFTLGMNAYRNFVVRKVFNDRCHIRILVLDPESPMLEHRAHDEPDKDVSRIRRKLQDTIAHCNGLKDEYEYRLKQHEAPTGSFCLKTYRGIPYFGYSRMDETCYVTLYSGDEYGISSPVVEVSERDSRLFRSLEMHFEALWRREDSKIVVDIGLSSFR